MPASIQITNKRLGQSYTWPDNGNLPLVERRIINERRLTEGASTRTRSFNLSGFFTGDTHDEVMQKFNLLHAICSDNTVFVSYTDGVNIILQDQMMYVDSINEPGDWKQYIGDYQIEMHYREEPLNNANDLIIAASYIPDDAPVYNFELPPFWKSSTAPSRRDTNQRRSSPAGERIGDNVEVTLTGSLTAANPQALKVKMDTMTAAFQADGILNYNNWSNKVRVVSAPVFDESFPTQVVRYTITLSYNNAKIHSMSSKRTITRIHQFPKIRDRIYCNNRKITLFDLKSGQTITYSISIKADDTQIARTILINEVANMIHPNRVEMPGGTEDQDDDSGTVSIKVIKFYDKPIYDNIDLTP